MFTGLTGHRPATRLLFGGLAAVTVATVLSGTSTAAAAVPNIEQHRSSSVASSADKGTTVACPSGRALTGLGADVVSGGGSVVIDDLVPNGTRTQAGTFGYEVDPFAARWSLHAYGICASPRAGAVRVAATSAANGVDGKSVVATCPAGKRLTGAGGRVNGGLGNVVMDDVVPIGNPATAVRVTGLEINPDANWSVTAFALCANPLAGQSVVSATSAVNSVNKSATVSCPAGRVVTGLGGAITGGSGEVLVAAYRPSETLDSVTVTGLEADDADGPFAGNWSIRAYAICATP